jgi:oligoribonuclease (3'-5' exoribonuclease)
MDTFLLEELKETRINISQMAEEAARSAISFSRGDVKGLDEKLLKLKLNKLEKEIIKRQTEASQIKEKLTQIDKKRGEIKEKTLENEKKLLEKQKNCINCGNIISEDNKILLKEDTIMCKGCYFTIDPAQLKKYI